MDQEGILRVGGRLQHSLLSFNEKHPIILPHHHHFTDLVIQNAHQITLHGGNQATLAYIRRKFWIIDAKSVIRKIIHKCIQCSRYKATTLQQAMGILPSPRVTPSRPFLYTGVDYAGPFNIKSSKLRGARIQKAYVAIFICLATKAIHVEVISDLTTEAFLAALKRMTARRGAIAHIYSDCGTTFIGADREIERRFYSMLQQAHTDIAGSLISRGTQWHFNPPAAPHFGGIWEAGVKSIKHHLKRIVGSTTLTFEELTTVLYQIEACLNSRPLCPISSDPDDLAVLTPGHFLIGDALVTPPELTNPEFSTYLTRWKLMNKLQNDFWKAWSTEYLSRLQQRPKWRTQHENVQTGDIVLIKDEDTPPSKWPLARIIETHPGQDGLVRVVTLRTAKTTIKRPITKICKLPISDEGHLSEATTSPTTIIAEEETDVHQTSTVTSKENNTQKIHHEDKGKACKNSQLARSSHNKLRKRTRIQPVQGYSSLIPLEEQERLAKKYKSESRQTTSKPTTNARPSSALALNTPTILCLLLLFFISMAAGSFNITYPKPGLYIEHIGQAKLRRGTLRLELNFPSNVTADITQVNRTIAQMKGICDKTREFSKEIHCDLLVQHLNQKQRTLLGELEIIRNKGMHRGKRSVIGRVFEAIFGGNEDIYQNIDALKENQELLRHTAHHQSTLLLSTMATLNHTEVRTTQKINLLTAKLNKVITEVNSAQGWFSSIDHNKANIHILSSYQLASELINDIEQHYVKLVEAMLGKGSLFDFVSPRQLADIIKSAMDKIPAYLQLAHDPEKRIEICINDTSIKIFGYLHITGTYNYTIDKVTPIPQKIGNQTFVGADISTPIIATNYDTQTYFTLTEAELERCIKQEIVLLCNPTVVSSIEANPNCIIDEIYHRNEKQPCPLKKFTTPTSLWKHLYMKNTWLFISNQPLSAAIKCNGIREDAVLNGTGIIQIGQECLIQTKRNTLISETFSTIPVKSTFIKPINFNLSAIKQTNQATFTHLEKEPILKSSDDFADLMNEQRSIEGALYSGTWRTIGYHTATGTSAVVITIVLILIYKAKVCRRKSVPFNVKISPTPKQPPQPSKRSGPIDITTPQHSTSRTSYQLTNILKEHATPSYAVPAECLRNKHETQGN